MPSESQKSYAAYHLGLNGAIAILALCLFYFLFELFFNAYAAYSADEFWFAHAAYKFQQQLPYRDFPPYKTVLGYYFLMLPTLFSAGSLTTLLLIKNMLAVLNTMVLITASFFLVRFFSLRGVILSLALLLASEIVLSYSTNIRVDLLAYWFCLFALLCLLQKRFIFAGLLIGLGFITSQKTIWYMLACNIALLFQCCCFCREKNFIKQVFLFNLFAILIIALYVVFWAWVADVKTVWHSVFIEASAMYQLAWYGAARYQFWSVVVQYNPLLFLLAPFTVFSLFIRTTTEKHFADRCFVTIFALCIVILLIPYKQIFPYYMQVTFPAFLVLYAAFFDWLFIIFSSAPKDLEIKWIGRSGLIVLLTILFLVSVYLQLFFNLPMAYALVLLLPLLFALMLLFPLYKEIYFKLIFIPIIFIGFIYPLILFGVKVLAINGDYQRQNITTLEQLLQEGGHYVAGVDLFFNKSQPIAGMTHLMGPAINYLYDPSPKIRAMMIKSLDADPSVTVESIIAAFPQAQVKFYVNNYRMRFLPDKLKNFLAQHFIHYWGSIYRYAPNCPAGQQQLKLWFSGHYLLQTNTDKIYLNDKPYAANQVYYLQKGIYQSKAFKNYRLIWVPENKSLYLNAAFQQDNWVGII